MKNTKIHISQLVSLDRFKIKTPAIDELKNSQIKERIHGICFDVYRYDSELISINYNKQMFSCRNKNFKITNNKEYSILYYVSKYPDTFNTIKANNFFYSDFLKNYLFNFRIKHMKKVLFECVKEVDLLFPKEETKKEIRIFYLKKNIFVADESFIRLEISNFFHNSIPIKTRNLELEKKINEYYSISNNLQNLNFSSKTKILPKKNLSLFKYLPTKINDKNFKLLNKLDNENIALYELFIDRNLNFDEDLNILNEGLKNFVAEYFDNTSIKQNFDVMYLNHRRQFRLDLKKKFGITKEDMLLQLFLDEIVFFTRDYSKFEEIVKGFIQHIEKFYI